MSLLDKINERNNAGSQALQEEEQMQQEGTSQPDAAQVRRIANRSVMIPF